MPQVSKRPETTKTNRRPGQRPKQKREQRPMQAKQDTSAERNRKSATRPVLNLGHADGQGI